MDMDHDAEADQAVQEWADAVARELGLEEPVARAAGGSLMRELSTRVADGVEPGAAVTAAYLIGVAAGRASDPGVAARDFVQQVTHLATGWTNKGRGEPAHDQSRRA
jgi:aconitase B